MTIQRILAMVFLALTAALLFLEFSSRPLRSLVSGAPVEILILGIDQAENTHRADTIALLRLEPKLGFAKVLQIPRDTLVKNSQRTQKINALYEKGGAMAIEQAVNQLLFENTASSMAVVPKRPYVVLNFAAFEKAFGVIGSMNEDIPVAGPEEALEAVRERNEQGDLGRLNLQRDFYGSLLQELKARPWKMAALAVSSSRLRKFLKSDLNAYEMASLLWRTRSWLNNAQVYFFPLPGRADQRGNFKAALPPSFLTWWKGEGIARKNSGPVRLEVLNASGQPGLAFRWTRLLRSLGDYDVLYFGNSSLEKTHSVLVTRQADLVLAKKILVSLNNRAGLRASHQVSPGAKEGVHFTLFLGEDAKESPLLKRAGWLEDL